jgi:hypothetical protein
MGGIPHEIAYAFGDITDQSRDATHNPTTSTVVFLERFHLFIVIQVNIKRIDAIVSCYVAIVGWSDIVVAAVDITHAVTSGNMTDASIHTDHDGTSQATSRMTTTSLNVTAGSQDG